jgi:predicted XRE-type DNA-binding protein
MTSATLNLSLEIFGSPTETACWFFVLELCSISVGSIVMLTTALVHEIDRLLREKQLSHRQIAARLAVSRGTISAIANGKRNLYGKDAPMHAARVTNSPPTRCPKCGYRVYLPCLVCRIREHKSRQAAPPLVVVRRPAERFARVRRTAHLRAS